MLEKRKKQVGYIVDKIPNYISKSLIDDLSDKFLEIESAAGIVNYLVSYAFSGIGKYKRNVVKQFKITLEEVLNENSSTKKNECLLMETCPKEYLNTDILTEFGASGDKIKKTIAIKFGSDWFMLSDMWNYFKKKEVNEEEYKNYVKKRSPTREKFMDYVIIPCNEIKKLMDSKDFDINTAKARDYILESMPGFAGRSFRFLSAFGTLVFGNAVDGLKKIFGITESETLKKIFKELISYYSLKIIDVYKQCAENEANEIYADN